MELSCCSRSSALCQCEFIDRARTRLGCAPLHAGEHSGTLVRAILTSWISSVSMIMWYHRRHAAARATNEDHDLASPMQQSSVEQWLEEQNAPSYVGQYSHETWYVINLFHPLAPSPAHVVDSTAWLCCPDDVMRGMPRAGPWIQLPYKAQPIFLLPNSSSGQTWASGLFPSGLGTHGQPRPSWRSWTRSCYLGVQGLISEMNLLKAHLHVSMCNIIS